MEIIEIKSLENNLNLLETFIKQKHPSLFRYYNSRSIEAIKNHKLTVICVVNNNPIAYGHIDNANEVNWIGLCVLDEFQGKGYGKHILLYLLEYIKTNNIENVQLSVDIDNYKAKNLYLKYSFKISCITNKYYIMEYNPIL
jgi:ribosomal protein S18 acetylase RimI-like enzyme